jgi:hypothetical protein
MEAHTSDFDKQIAGNVTVDIPAQNQGKTRRHSISREKIDNLNKNTYLDLHTSEVKTLN